MVIEKQFRKRNATKGRIAFPYLDCLRLPLKILAIDQACECYFEYDKKNLQIIATRDELIVVILKSDS